MTPKAISDVNRSERIEPYQFLNGYTAQDWRDFIENVTEGAAEFRGNDYRRLIGDLEEAASLIARLRMDAERADRYLKLLRDWTGCEPEDLDAATAPKQVADSSGRAEEDGNG